MARLHDSRHGSDADGIDDDDMPLTHEQAVVEADAELRRMTYHPVRKAVGIVVAMGVAIGASLGVGYMFGGDPGGIVTAITGVVCPQDAKYALDGDAPFVNTSDTSEHPAKGARLSEKDAGQYYLEAVKPSIQPLRDAMNTLYGGDLKATRAAAGKAATVLRATAKALRSRTWPDEVANAAAVVANEYDAKARQASYVADSVTPSASDELISLDAYGVSEADVYLRGKLGLLAAEAPSAPLEITGIEDRGIQQGGGCRRVDRGHRKAHHRRDRAQPRARHAQRAEPDVRSQEGQDDARTHQRNHGRHRARRRAIHRGSGPRRYRRGRRRDCRRHHELGQLVVDRLARRKPYCGGQRRLRRIRPGQGDGYVHIAVDAGARSPRANLW